MVALGEVRLLKVELRRHLSGRGFRTSDSVGDLALVLVLSPLTYELLCYPSDGFDTSDGRKELVYQPYRYIREVVL